MLTSADPVNVVGSVLTRRFNQVGDVVKVGRGIWGLKEWYPGRNFKPVSRAAALIAASIGDPVALQGGDDGDGSLDEGGAGAVNMS